MDEKTKEAYEYLLGEFEARDNSFLIQLRTDLHWNHDSFMELLKAMELVCRFSQNDDKLERKMAQGFWYIPNFVEHWSSHENFPKIYSDDYYQLAYELIFLISDWYFTGHPNVRDHGAEFEKLERLSKH